MRRRERPPILDYLVFGTAFLLAAILAYYAFTKRPWQRAEPLADLAAPIRDALPSAEAPVEPTDNKLGASRSFALARESAGMKASVAPAPKKKLP